MAEHSQAAKMIDPSEPPGQLAAIGEMAGIRGAGFCADRILVLTNDQYAEKNNE